MRNLNNINNNMDNATPFYYNVTNIMEGIHEATMNGTAAWYQITETTDEGETNPLYERQLKILRGEINSSYYCEYDGLLITLANIQKEGRSYSDIIVTIARSENMDQMVVRSTAEAQFELAKTTRMLWNQLHNFSAIVNGRVEVSVNNSKYIA